ncbi:MAG: DUF2804 family protein [Solirubrobacteraceae bacterium]
MKRPGRAAQGALPYRGRFGDPRPEALAGLALPPDPMPARQGLRPLKAWRYIGIYGPELMLCLAAARIGPARQSFWAVWDRAGGRLHERTVMSPGAVRLGHGQASAVGPGVKIAVELEETQGIETVCASAASYAWTRKQGGIPARGTVTIDGVAHPFEARAVVDDTAAYYARHTQWRWCAGVGRARDGRALAWNLVEGVNDPPRGSERTHWVDGEPSEAPPARFAADLSAVGELRFAPEAVREHAQNLLVVRSRYRQPFGTFSGRLGDLELAEGYGVMEDHDVWW